VEELIDSCQHRRKEVFAWLWAIIINLLSFPGFYDIALRDFGLSLGALALARLSRDYDFRSR